MSTSSAQVLLASDFDNSIGVNAHVGVSDAYSNLDLMTNDLEYLGATKLRASLSTDPNVEPIEAGLAAEGYKFDFGVWSGMPAQGTAALTSYVQALSAFETAHPGSIQAVEGLNEEDIQAFSYNGSSTTTAAAAFQSALYQQVKSQAALSGVSVYNFTISDYNIAALAPTVNESTASDVANSHSYVSTGTTPQAYLAQSLALAQESAPGKPMVITETGYTNLESTPYLGTDQTVAAKSILNTLLDAFKDGVSSTYLYELFDEANIDPSSKEAHFGLFNADGTPKEAATAIHDLTTILADDGTGTSTPTTPLNYTLGNLPSSGQSMVLAKSNGAQDLVVWAEPKMWDPTTEQEISTAPQTVSVDLGAVYGSVSVYDPLTGTSAIATYTNAQTISIAVSDHPVVIEVNAPASVSPAVATTTSTSGTAASIVSQLSKLNATSTLTTINLTDTNVLPIASLVTMNYIISHYQNALSAIKGGYSFSISSADTNWTKTVNYDASGTFTSSTTDVLTNGVTTRQYVVNADGSQINYFYGITGQNFTSEVINVNASGAVVQDMRYDANGNVQYSKVINADGSSIVDLYNAAGVKTTEISVAAGVTTTDSFDASGQITGEVINGADGSTTTKVYNAGVLSKAYIAYADKSQDNFFYNVTGQSYTSEHAHIDATGKVTSDNRYYANGNLQYSFVLNPDGSKLVDLYDSTGAKTSEVGTAASGAVSTAFYTNGVMTRQYVANPDGSRDNYSSGITGQAYTSELVHVSPTGVITADTRYFASGAIQCSKVVNADGSSVTDVFSAPKIKASEVRISAGTTTTDLFDASGQLVTETVKAADGSTTANSYTAGVKTASTITYADNSQDKSWYNITGQAYTSEQSHINASGTTTSDNRYYANGTLQYSMVVNADGSKIADTYDTTGAKSSEVTTAATGIVKSVNFATNGATSKQTVVNADGSSDNYTFGIKGQAYTSEDVHVNASGVMTADTRYYASGALQYSKVINPNGSSLVDLYGTTGLKTTEIKTNANATTTDLFNAAGQIATESIKAADGSITTNTYTAGVMTRSTVAYADGSQDNYWFNVVGQSYSSEHAHVNANGTVAYDDRYYASGALQFSKVLNNDGSTVVDIYDTSGAKTTEVTTGADGTVTTALYTNGALTRQYVVEPDGSKDNYSYGITGQSYTSEHQHISASGITTSDLRYYSNGNLQSSKIIKNDGSSVTDLYSNAGIKTNEAVFNSTGTLQDNIAFNSDGSTSTTLFASNLAMSFNNAVSNIAYSGSNSDTLSFASTPFHDFIQGFHGGAGTGHDTIVLAKALVADFAHLDYSTNGTTTTITLDNQHSIALHNMTGSLVAQDFRFV